jgi:hypothetical protein
VGARRVGRRLGEETLGRILAARDPPGDVEVPKRGPGEGALFSTARACETETRLDVAVCVTSAIAFGCVTGSRAASCESGIDTSEPTRLAITAVTRAYSATDRMIRVRVDDVNGRCGQPRTTSGQRTSGRDAQHSPIWQHAHDRKESVMFDELTEELLDLTATVRGRGGAMYAAVTDPGSSSNLCSSIILCCTCTTLCW